MQDVRYQSGSGGNLVAGDRCDAPTCPPTAEHDVIHMDSVQLSRRLNISIKSLSRMRQKGTGPRFLRIGAKVVYRLSDVLAYEQSRLYDAVDMPVAQGGEV
ncbi:helix-turn-helix domain-containing protein [Endozoicomonas atrinae]|uniref:helix-turn-helix domain-containing protein n=1 Tax=Endozoicomonas atrinae TaxID=1333660 RepID=UPI000A7C6EA0|nr:helix-turn-helix domain-containing protein [Endozoicomonas atrinae]